jgi:predicted ester cyclase
MDIPSDPKAVVTELFRRMAAGERAVDDLIADDMINHAAGPQGRDAWLRIVDVISTDFGDDMTVEHHHLIAEGELVAHHMTIHGTHRASTMPLLAGATPTGEPVSWTYMHLWRVAEGLIVEHWACRDDVGLLRQVGAWS